MGYLGKKVDKTVDRPHRCLQIFEGLPNKVPVLLHKQRVLENS